MSRNVRGFMSLFHSEKPVLCKVHGFCVAGGTDMALCSDLLVIAEDAKIGYPPARVWGSPTTAMWASRLGPMRAKRLLLTGDSLTGAEAAEWGLATEAAPAAELDARFERLLERVARMPVNQLVMMKLLVNQTVHAQGLAHSQVLGTFFDGVARHTEEGHAFVRRAAEAGFREAVRERDEPYGDFGLEGFGLELKARGPTSPRSRPEHIREFARESFPGDLGIEPLEIERRRARAAGSSSTAATCIPAATSTAASGPRSATPSPPGSPSATSRRTTTSRRSS